MDHLIILIFMLLFSFINYHLAKKRNRSEIGWAIGGFFLGHLAPLSTIILLLLGDSKIRCENCGYIHRSGIRCCPNCKYWRNEKRSGLRSGSK